MNRPLWTVAMCALSLVIASAAPPWLATAHARRAKRASKPIPTFTPKGLPNIQAGSAVIMDTATTAELFGKDAEAVRGIASTGKIFVAMVVRKRGLDLDGATEITKTDRDFARGGARTRLSVGHKYKNRDLLRAMLIASDNRAPTALGRAVGLSPKQLVAAMNDLARELGLDNTAFTDPSGLRGNVSTAREMAYAFREALRDPLLRQMMGREDVSIRAVNARRRSIHYRNTNKALHSKRHPVLAGKTGFTNAAGYCLLIAAEVEGREVIVVLLGTREKLTRYGDFNRATAWLLAGRAPRPGAVVRIADQLGKASLEVGVSAAATGSL